MNEKEKKAIEKLKEYALCKVNDNGYVEVSANGYKHTILNLIEKQQKELNNLKKIEKSHQEENGKLRVELEQEKEKNKELEKDNKNLNILLDAKYKDVTYMLLNYISKDKIKAIVDEHIPKQPNIITGEMEYTPNANSFLVQDILKLLEEK